MGSYGKTWRLATLFRPTHPILNYSFEYWVFLQIIYETTRRSEYLAILAKLFCWWNYVDMLFLHLFIFNSTQLSDAKWQKTQVYLIIMMWQDLWLPQNKLPISYVHACHIYTFHDKFWKNFTILWEI